MKRVTIALLGVMCVGIAAPLQAQESLVGRYVGSYEGQARTGGTRSNGVELNITSEENGIVKGEARLVTAGSCAGAYPMEGRFENNKLVMRATSKGGGAGDCSFSFNAVKEGNKLVGTTGTSGSGRPLQLSK